MTDTTVGETNETSKRKQVSKRGFIDAAGKEVDKMEEATGASYTLLGEGGKTFTVQIGEAGKAATMFGIFGAHTKIGNVANTVLNDKENPGSPVDAGEAIAEFLSDAESGTWAERTGGVGAKIDKDALAAAYVEYGTANGKTALNDGRPFTLQNVREMLEDKPILVRQLRAVPEIAKLYADRVGKPVKSVEEVMNLV